MKKAITLILILLFLITGCMPSGIPSDETELSSSLTSGSIQTSRETETTTSDIDTTASIPAVLGPETEYRITLKRDVLSLMAAYPDHVTGAETKYGYTYIVMKSGKRLLYDDGKFKNFEEKMNDADIQDMMEIIYPLKDIYTLMDVDLDPGRIRAYSIFNEIYGGTEDIIGQSLTTIGYGSQELLFSNTAGAASALIKTVEEEAAYVKLIPRAASYLYPSSGTVNYRTIEGTDLLSLHAYGIAIDLNSNAGGYWRWASQAEGEKQIRYYPKGLIRIFENNGFIWGGKWYHFDAFHFEYRPELIIKAKYFSEKINILEPWYQGADLSDEKIKEYIALIDSSLD